MEKKKKGRSSGFGKDEGIGFKPRDADSVFSQEGRKTGEKPERKKADAFRQDVQKTEQIFGHQENFGGAARDTAGGGTSLQDKAKYQKQKQRESRQPQDTVGQDSRQTDAFVQESRPPDTFMPDVRVSEGKAEDRAAFSHAEGFDGDVGNKDRERPAWERHSRPKQRQGSQAGEGISVKPEGKEDKLFSANEGFTGRAEPKADKRKKREIYQRFQKQKESLGQDVQASQGESGQGENRTFTEDRNQFTGESGNEQEESQFREFQEEYRCKDTFHRTEERGNRKRRQIKGDRNRKSRNPDSRTEEWQESKGDFQTKDTTFMEDAGQKFSDKKKSDRLQEKAEKAGKRVEKAKKKLPKKTEYSMERVFDEKTGKAKYVLAAVKKEKPFSPDNPLKQFAGKAGREPIRFAHGKVAEVEKENSAVEGAHKSEQKAEDAYRFVKGYQKGRHRRLEKKVTKLEKKRMRAEVNFQYQKFLEDNPQMQEKSLKKMLQKRMQKQRIKREYVKALKNGKAAKNTREAATKTADFTTAAAKKVQELASKHASVLVTAGAVALLLVMVMTAVSSCGAMFSNGMSTTLAGSYLSEPAQIDAADLAFSEMEKDLQKQIDSIETDYPDYDEYRYNLDAIGHDPFALISYLSAVHTEFTAADVQGEVESLFDEMYGLTLTPATETRTRTVTKTGTRTVTDPDTGEETEEEYEYEEEEEYTVSILNVTLTAKDLGVIMTGRMNGEQKEIYALYNETHGLIQQFYTPLALYWYNYVSSYYGYRINPVTGVEELHRGVDIAVPTGTAVYAAMDGTVTEARYDSYYGNYVVITDSDGYCTKYAHMDTLNVHRGQTVTHGAVIGTTGNTGSSSGSHLHIECLYNGEYYNPLFYFEAGEGTLYGESQAAGSGGNAIPPDAYDDASVQALMEEAAKYIGYPYVWGGSSPSTSFDCSGYVCWVFTNSGVHNLPRTTAQGIYNQCTPVSAADAKAGDIIFFTGTYNSGSPVTHVGIYCGNGVMAHAGDPIKYSSIHTPYWQSHYYGFGRLN